MDKIVGNFLEQFKVGRKQTHKNLALYREPEERAERARPKRGSKTDLVEHALENMIGPFGISDVEQLCLSVSRDTIRLVMNRWRKQDKLEMLGKGRDATWQRKT